MQNKKRVRHMNLRVPLKLATIGALCSVATIGAASAPSAEVAALPNDLTALSLDQLLQIEVTSVSKRPEKALEAPAAIYVLSGEDIRRAGAQRIAEALRLVPGLNVARSDSRTYTITSRGFGTDKLQVLLDGRAVYTPLTSAVFWDVLDTYLDDIERIEVIRGPGATLWGANAVNGVINIVTRRAQDTTGTVVSGGGGSQQRAFGALRSGTALGQFGAARVYAKGSQHGAGNTAGGDNADDAGRMERSGFRADGRRGQQDNWTLSGDLYAGRFNTPKNPVLTVDEPTRVRGGNLLGRWTRGEAAAQGWSLQTYYDRYQREIPGIYAETRDTVDVDFQLHHAFGSRQSLLYGLGYRQSHDDTADPSEAALVFLPTGRRLQTWSAFVQDQVALGDDLTLTLGSKFEHNDFTEFEWQPGLRFGWSLGARAYTWAAVSRAVRTPNRLDSDIAIFCPEPDGYPDICEPGLLRIGNPDFGAEKLTAYEWGLRLWGANSLTFDLASFYNDYDKLRSQEAQSAEHPFGFFENNHRAHAYGGELTLGWNPSVNVRLQSFYGLLVIEAERRPGSTDATGAAVLEGASPRHQAGLRLLTSPAPRWHVDGFLRHVGALPAYDIDAYTELDLRLAYRPTPDIEIALAGRNLLHDDHVEFGGGYQPTAEARARRPAVARSGFIEIRWFWP